MSAMLLLFVCLILGTLVARYAKPPAGIVQGINWWVLNVALSALVLELIPKVSFDPQLWFLVAVMWLTFALLSMSLYLMSSWTPMLLGQSGLSMRSAALITSAYHTGGVIGSFVAAFLIRRSGDLPPSVQSPADETPGRSLCPPHGPPHRSSGPPA